MGLCVSNQCLIVHSWQSEMLLRSNLAKALAYVDEGNINSLLEMYRVSSVSNPTIPTAEGLEKINKNLLTLEVNFDEQEIWCKTIALNTLRDRLHRWNYLTRPSGTLQLQKTHLLKAWYCMNVLRKRWNVARWRWLVATNVNASHSLQVKASQLIMHLC